MHKTIFSLAMLVSFALTYPAHAELATTQEPEETSETQTTASPEAAEKAKVPFSAFTGKIRKNKVRLRLQPNLDGPILRELSAGDLVVALGEVDDFYAVEAPADIKGYIYRTYVLDGVIEGNHVNIRIAPDLSSSIIGQLNSGDHVTGTTSPLDKKWFEINLPNSTRFYVSKEYVERVGDLNFMTALNKRRETIKTIFNTAYNSSQVELQKPFNSIHLDGIIQSLKKLIAQYPDFPEEIAKAKELLQSIQTAYLNKKIANMETSSKDAAVAPAATPELAPPTISNGKSSKMTVWEPVEQHVYEQWKENNEQKSMDAFYEEQLKEAVTLKGIIEPFQKTVKNKPGDFVLVGRANDIPLAYLYSTKVNLQDYMGQEVTLQLVPRDNHHFAYPAYFVLSVEKQ